MANLNLHNTTKRHRVVVAMSGGVDSSVAAALLKEKGYDVIGISMQLWDYSGGEKGRPGSCCSVDDIYDARRVADSIGIPFYVVNLEEAFSKEVVDYFVEGYLDGQTPNPCIKCNQILKFNLLLRKTMELEADFLATGHYARIGNKRKGERIALFSGRDMVKDQSYFLFTMTQFQLSRLIFPLGDMKKSEVRQHASRFGLNVADKDESQEICFVQNGNYKDFIAKSVKAIPGYIVDRNGNRLGVHRGIFNYTVGQRKGLGVGNGIPLYVLEINKEENRVIVGGKNELFTDGLIATDINWIAIDGLNGPLAAETKIRYGHKGIESTIHPMKENSVAVRFKMPQMAITPGQAAVFYQGDKVIGGGWIKRAIS
ncbi:MAG: tRNA 2-thiouridine(34) synthase MnmA [Thermodesulfobacteriota bacterium]